MPILLWAGTGGRRPGMAVPGRRPDRLPFVAGSDDVRFGVPDSGTPASLRGGL
ncbi:hypothetical protein [Streptosporangium sp. OZ121]|uniref:hypothetical protein n=1 Tax=Streptosporangium sp. OZ121 TaxID=3444183 RepID=UPI003F792C21